MVPLCVTFMIFVKKKDKVWGGGFENAVVFRRGTRSEREAGLVSDMEGPWASPSNSGVCVFGVPPPRSKLSDHRP